MIALGVAKRNLSLNKAKKKNNFFVESFDHCRRLEVHEKSRNVLVTSLHLSDHNVVTQHRILIKFFFISLGCSHCFRSYFVLQIFGFKEFNKTIIPFALVGYETGYSQLGATRLVDYLPSHVQRALME